MAFEARVPLLRRTARGASAALRRGLSRTALPREGCWLALHLDAAQGELPVPSPRRDAPQGLLDTLVLLEAAAGDPRLCGVAIHLVGPLSGWSAAEALRRAIASLAARGKPVLVYAEQLDESLLLVASAATRLLMPETGRVQLLGLRAEGFYFRDLLERVDVRPEVVRIGTHKSAAEAFTRSGMSPEQREQLEALLDVRFDSLVDGIAAGRGLSPDRVRELIDRGPYTATRARDEGLIDGCAYPDELEEVLRSLQARSAAPPARRVGGGEGSEGTQVVGGGGFPTPPGPHTPAPPARRVARIDARSYRSLCVDAATSASAGSIGYLVAQGSIRQGEGRGVATASWLRLLEQMRTRSDVAGVVLRIDSPGGDALASDLLWRGIDRLRRDKPVVASMAEVAASGGYYMASAADRVFAERGSVTGSIGVIGGKLNLEGLYDRLGIGRDAVERGARAGLSSETRSFTPAERAVVRGEMQELYAAFVDRVARGRGLDTEAVERVAQGRVWSGAAALAAGLVDAIGGPLEAIAETRRRAGLSVGERTRLDLHPRVPPLVGLLALLRRRL